MVVYLIGQSKNLNIQKFKKDREIGLFLQQNIIFVAKNMLIFLNI